MFDPPACEAHALPWHELVGASVAFVHGKVILSKRFRASHTFKTLVKKHGEEGAMRLLEEKLK